MVMKGRVQMSEKDPWVNPWGDLPDLEPGRSPGEGPGLWVYRMGGRTGLWLVKRASLPHPVTMLSDTLHLFASWGTDSWSRSQLR